MVEKKTNLSKYKTIINQNAKGQNSYDDVFIKRDSDSVVLFFSFDIVNSSMYKTINYYGWSAVLHSLIKKLRDDVKEKMNRAEVWRVLGDEVIFIITVCDMDSIYEYIGMIYEILLTFSNSLDDEGFFQNISNLNPWEIDLMKLQNVISLKACSWIAAVTDRDKVDASGKMIVPENIFEVFEESSNNKFYEFIGQDIDAGFRLSKYTRERRLALSFELAYLLSRKKEYNKKMHIIAYRKLKGIWGGKWYPIIWYYDSAKNNEMKFTRSIPFDAIKEDEIYKEYFGKKELAEYMYQSTEDALEKILVDRKLQYKIDNIYKIIEYGKDKGSSFLYDSRLELHCVAVCFGKDKKVFIAKRRDRNILNDCWELGCAKANSKKELAESIIEEYRCDFGFSIQLIEAQDRKDKEPIPIALYKVEKGKELHKGIIVLAKVLEGEVQLNNEKHSEYRWISKAEVELLEDNECVPDMRNTLKLAFDVMERIDKNGR